MKTVLFYQHFGKKGVVRGAHHKTYDFFCHIKSYTDYKPVIFFDKDSIWDENLPWYDCFDSMPTLDDLKEKPDILFLNSGKDWIKYLESTSIPKNIPIISPVNNFRAINPSHKSYEFLPRKAIRLCPSQELYEAVVNHPLTNGKTIYLPNGVGIDEGAQKIKYMKEVDVLIVGNKNPEMANLLYSKIKHLNIKIDKINCWVSKKDFQIKLAKSHISVHLPKTIEEHYIPGVEAMMLGSLVIIPDCVGNRSYSKHLETCYLAEYNVNSMLKAINYILHITDEEKEIIKKKAVHESKQFLLKDERKVLYNILRYTDKIWK